MCGQMSTIKITEACPWDGTNQVYRVSGMVAVPESGRMSWYGGGSQCAGYPEVCMGWIAARKMLAPNVPGIPLGEVPGRAESSGIGAGSWYPPVPGHRERAQVLREKTRSHKANTRGERRRENRKPDGMRSQSALIPSGLGYSLFSFIFLPRCYSATDMALRFICLHDFLNLEV